MGERKISSLSESERRRGGEGRERVHPRHVGDDGPGPGPIYGFSNLSASRDGNLVFWRTEGRECNIQPPLAPFHFHSTHPSSRENSARGGSEKRHGERGKRFRPRFGTEGIELNRRPRRPRPLVLFSYATHARYASSPLCQTGWLAAIPLAAEPFSHLRLSTFH